MQGRSKPPRPDPVGESVAPTFSSEDPYIGREAPGWLGINVLRMPVPDDDVPDGGYGYFDEVVADVAAIRGGHIRQLGVCDLDWQHLTEGAVIPPPVELFTRAYTELTGNGRFLSLLIACLALEVKLVPTLFERGGGSALNPKGQSSSPQPVSDDVTVTWAAAFRGKPSWCSSLMVSSAAGWDGFYWDPAEVGGWLVSADKQAFQQVALSLYAEPVTEGGYMHEAARRKCIALLAYGHGVGAGLAALDSVVRSAFGHGLRKLVPYLECGNELDTYWQPSVADTSDSSSVARLVGRFHGCLAASVAQQWSGARFRLGELSSARSEEDWLRVSLVWLERACTDGLQDCVTLLNGIREQWRLASLGGPSSLWLSSMEASQFYWGQPEDFGELDAADLLHQVGFHYYLDQDREWNDGDPADYNGYGNLTNDSRLSFSEIR